MRQRPNGFGSMAVRCGLGMAVAVGLLIGSEQTASAQTLTTLHSFTGSPDGAFPLEVTLVADPQGNLFGTTFQGGNPICGDGCGTVFEVTPDGIESVLHSFSGTDGSGPTGGLVIDAQGNLYGTTQFGGTHKAGTVFKLSPDGTQSVLYNFGTTSSDGLLPFGPLIMDSQQNLYGVTGEGGSNQQGTVFEVTQAGVETVLYSFKGGLDGAEPQEGLTMDSKGNLYGTTAHGGAHNRGVVFKVAPGGSETVLASLGPHGKQASSQLVLDGNGNLYGTAAFGGPHQAGTVFRVSPSGKLTALHNFANAPTDGSRPVGLLMDQAGNLYGSTTVGGTSNCGSIYKLTLKGAETLLASLSCGASSDPFGGLLMDSQGNLYGTTLRGTADLGSVFKLTP